MMLFPNDHNHNGEPRDLRETGFARAYGCGCALPGSGVLLVALTIVVFILLARHIGFGPSPLWFIFILLVLGIVLLFGHVRVRK